MTATTFADDLVREYLLFRGFIATSKAYEAELKSDRDKGFRVDKIVDQLCSYITSYDLMSLREAWLHLDQRIFSRLELAFMPTVRKLENSLLKMYVINTVQTNRHDKMTEFFDRLSQDLQNQLEWKEWFVLPFIKNAEENPVFQVYFTRQWQDTMLVSLHNFLSVIFQSMTLPTLMSYEEEQNKLAQLQEENEALKMQLAALQMKERRDSLKFPIDNPDNDIPVMPELMDDFYVIAQREAPTSDGQLKSIRSIIKNISSGLPTSPILGRRPSSGHFSAKKIIAEEALPARSSLPRTKKTSVGGYPAQASGSLPRSKNQPENEIGSTRHILRGSQSKEELLTVRTTVGSVSVKREQNAADSSQTEAKSFARVKVKTRAVQENEENSSFLLLSQEEFNEHHSAITHCKFNASGTLIASSDSDGVVKIWSPSPTPRTLATVISKSSNLALEWAHKRERLLLLGNRAGLIRLYDTREKKTLCEVGIDGNGSSKDHRVMCLACSPTGNYFASGSASRARASPTSDKLCAFVGKLLLWDLKIMKLDKQLSLGSFDPEVNCCTFNHNGQLLVAGTADGQIHLYDMQQYECIMRWQAHSGETYSVQFSADETSCFSMGSDGKLKQWSINKTGQKMNEFTLHDRCAGPFSRQPGSATSAISFCHPVGKLFVFDVEGKYVLSCADNSGIIYRLIPGQDPALVLQLGGHKSSVLTVDWATTVDCGICTTASVDGKIRISTILAQ